MWNYVLCTGCGQVVMALEPCPCVFEVNGVVDECGVLHTPQRLKLELLHPTFPPEELALGEWRCQATPEWTEEDLDAAVADMDEVEERAALETERAAEWAVRQFVSQYGEDWLDEGDRGEMAYRRINRADPNYEPVYSREQAARQDVFDMAKGKMPRAFR